MLRGNAGSQHGPDVVGINFVFTGELAEHAKRRPERLLDRRRIQVGKGGGDFRVIAVPEARRGGVCGDAKRRFVGLGDERGHQLEILDHGHPLRTKALRFEAVFQLTSASVRGSTIGS
jgi:hypothetical protein